MSDAPTLAGLDDIRALVSGTDPDARLLPLGLGHLIIGPGVLDQVVDAVAGLVPPGGKEPASVDRKSTRLNSSHPRLSRMPSSA